MGWWGFGIMDGDTPLDVVYDVEMFIHDHREVDDWMYNRDDVDMLFRFVEREYGSYRERPEYILPLGAFLMDRGYPLEDAKKQLIYNAIEIEQYAAWSRPEVREAVLRKFRKVVEDYGTVPMAQTKAALDELCSVGAWGSDVAEDFISG